MMSYAEEILQMSKSDYSDIELLEYINEHFDEIECELSIKSQKSTVIIFVWTVN